MSFNQPMPRGYLGEPSTSLNPYWSANVENSDAEKWVPLSLITVWGIPVSENILFIPPMVAAADVLSTCLTNGIFEK